MMALLLNANDSVSRSYSITKPSPLHPIEPSECGERTANRFDTDTIYSAYKQADGTYQGTVNNFYTLHPTPFTADDIGKEFTFAIKVNATTSGNIRASANVNGTSINGNGLSAPGITKVTFTVSSTSDYLYLNYGSGGGNQITISDIMLSEGQTALPYEPYGYKLPLLSGSTPVDIYFGESQTTRRIKKLVLTGEESWRFYEEENVWQFYTNNIISGLTSSSCMSNIAEYGATATTRGRYSYGAYLVSHGRGIAFQMIGSKDAFVDVASWKSYIAQQYANGTPVTVWYVLATEETGTLNEPLRKIGNYVDTIDSTQTTAQIPTTANSTTISWAGQGLEPSQFDSIAEWVSATPKIYTNGAWADAQTYMYDDGAWVADN